jgi:protein-L-isoaspartate(D-aspartate) O-methyltransferase
VEIEPHLAQWGAENVARAGMPWAEARVADPDVLGLPGEGPWDRILVSAQARHLPQALVDELADPGRLVVPVAGRMSLVVLEGGSIRVTEHGYYRFVPLLTPAPPTGPPGGT